jgi:hypothetical protein
MKCYVKQEVLLVLMVVIHNILNDIIKNLPDSTQQFLLGKDFKKVKNILNILALERGLIDINQLDAMSRTSCY